MEIIVGPIQSTQANAGTLKVAPTERSARNKDRRKKKQDRRENVREGIFVSLSVKEDNRCPGDRRRSGG